MVENGSQGLSNCYFNKSSETEYTETGKQLETESQY